MSLQPREGLSWRHTVYWLCLHDCETLLCVPTATPPYTNFHQHLRRTIVNTRSKSEVFEPAVSQTTYMSCDSRTLQELGIHNANVDRPSNYTANRHVVHSIIPLSSCRVSLRHSTTAIFIDVSRCSCCCCSRRTLCVRVSWSRHRLGYSYWSGIIFVTCEKETSAAVHLAVQSKAGRSLLHAQRTRGMSLIQHIYRQLANDSMHWTSRWDNDPSGIYWIVWSCLKSFFWDAKSWYNNVNTRSTSSMYLYHTQRRPAANHAGWLSGAPCLRCGDRILWIVPSHR